jgi:serine phosphatase RsbU (regulator of sigma subunit)
VTNNLPSHLRVVSSEPTFVSALGDAREKEFAAAFCQATGWELRYDSQSQNSPVRLSGPNSPGKEEALPFSQAQKLANAVAPLLTELQTARQALVAREAELAAGVPVALKADEQHLAERLEGILKSGAQAAGCIAAALYLLDDATTTLKLRAAHGLPATRLLDPPRPLRGAVADLEALIGHAVVLEDTHRLPHWKAPENFPAAVCVPVSSPSLPLGTLWVFADSPRDFNDEQTNLLEIVAGRIAAELERESLVNAGISVHQENRQRESVAEWQRGRLPSVAPLVDGWEIGGFTLPAGMIGREFFDWQMLSSDQLCVAVGTGSGQGMAAALNAAVLHSAHRAHAYYPQGPDKVLERLNETLWSAGQGDQFGALGLSSIDPITGMACFAATGGIGALRVAKDRAEFLAGSRDWLGQTPDRTYPATSFQLLTGDLLLLASAELIAEGDAGAFDPDSLADFLRRYRRHSLEGMLSALRTLVLRAAEGTDRDATIVAVRRLGR